MAKKHTKSGGNKKAKGGKSKGPEKVPARLSPEDKVWPSQGAAGQGMGRGEEGAS